LSDALPNQNDLKQDFASLLLPCKFVLQCATGGIQENNEVMELNRTHLFLVCADVIIMGKNMSQKHSLY